MLRPESRHLRGGRTRVPNYCMLILVLCTSLAGCTPTGASYIGWLLLSGVDCIRQVFNNTLQWQPCRCAPVGSLTAVRSRTNSASYVPCWKRPEVIPAQRTHHPPTKGRGRPFEWRAARARLRGRAGGAPAARRRREALGAAATPLARRPLAMSHRTGAPLERGGGGGSEVLAVCHLTLALGRSSKHALHRTS